MARDERAHGVEQDRRAFLRTVTAGSIAAGTAGFASGTATAETGETRELIRIVGGGDDLGPDYEEGHYYYDEVSGDFDVVVHSMALEGSTGWEKAGIMVRESLDPEAAHLMVRRNPDGEDLTDSSPASIQWRSEHGAQNQALDGIRAEWLRLRRAGDTFEIYGSMTGADWTQFGEFTTDDVDLSDDVVVGLAVTSIEWVAEQTVTATFKDLSGIDPTDNVDLGEPDHPGSVTVRTDVPITDTRPPTLEADSITLRGSISLPEDLDAAECRFQYREATGESWTTTESETLTSSGSFERTVPATDRRIYNVRAVADVPDAPDVRGATPTEGATLYVGTPSRSDGGRSGQHRNRALSPGVSAFGPNDGFAEAAPWLDDDTPIVRVTEPTREAVAEAFDVHGERLVVFETSGVIDLEGEQLSIRADNCYVAGQTAPSPGITFINGGLQIAADDCVLQHVRVRPGDYEQEEEWAPTSIQVQDTRENNVVDHCTTTWGIDENLTIGGRTSDTTYSNNLIAEPLHDSTHPKGPHGYGSLINPEAKNVALLGNVWTCNVDRNPRLRLASTNAVVNNLTYFYDDGCWLDPQTRASIVGNQYLSPQTDQPNVLTKSLDYGEGIPKAYLEDNYTDGDVPMLGEDVEALAEPPLWPDDLDALPSGKVRSHNLANAGARPADRTPHDERIVEKVRNENGAYIDSQEEVGGYPDLPENTHSLSPPQSGLRAWLREQSRRVETGGSRGGNGTRGGGR